MQGTSIEQPAPRVAVIILNWNGLDDTLACLASVLKVDYPAMDVVLVDNGSRGDDVEQIRSVHRDEIHYVISASNVGFAAGNNLGIRYAREQLGAKHVVLLNNDTVVDPGFLTALVEVAEGRPEAAVIASKMYFLARRDILWYAGGWMHVFGFHGHLGAGKPDGPPYDGLRETAFAPFCAVLLTDRGLRTNGLLCEDYFFLWEDLDYCAFARRRGMKIYYEPRSRIWHKVGASSSHEGSPSKIRQGMKGRIIFRRRYLGRWFWVYGLLFAMALGPIHILSYVLRRRWGLIPAMIAGIAEGVRAPITPAGPSRGMS